MCTHTLMHAPTLPSAELSILEASGLPVSIYQLTSQFLPIKICPSPTNLPSYLADSNWHLMKRTKTRTEAASGDCQI